MLLLWLFHLLQASPGIPVQNVLHASSQEAEKINRVTIYFFVVAGLILLVVTMLTAYVVFKFRERKREGASLQSPSKKWEIAMIGIPLALVGIFLFLTITTMNKVHPPAGDRAPDVIITGHQWWWEARYPGTSVVTANEIHLPAGKPLLLKLLSADVIHDWWIPQFGNKMDMVPTQEAHLWLAIKEPGEYYGICSEFCGAQHAHMRIKVVAQTGADYNDWLLHHQQPAVSTPAGGAQLFLTKTCGNCHRIQGTGAQGTVGPDLTHLASRKTLLAGLLENTQPNLESFIRDPQKIKPGVHMPDFLLDDTTVRAIAAYLYSLK